MQQIDSFHKQEKHGRRRSHCGTQMQAGQRVRIKSDPGRIGVLTGKTRQIADGLRYWQVQFPDRASFQLDDGLELVPDTLEHPVDLLRDGKLGRAKDLRGNLTHVRLTGRLANLIYSMETTNTDFYAYQFKPVLNFLDAPSNGILIADEVGLGKTIEAGLIWTELRARFDTRRLLVVCPAMLREKWQMELERRFGIDAQILDASQLLGLLKRVRSGTRNAYAAICSMQGLRPRRRLEQSDIAASNSSELAAFLDEHSLEEPLIDLTIVDEAHYMRNPETSTSRLGRLLRGVSDNLVLLSATPIHLRNQDLFQLLNLVDEDTFTSPSTFDEILQANQPILQARDGVLDNALNPEQFSGLLDVARSHHLLRENRQLDALAKMRPSQEQLNDDVFRSGLASRLERLNLLSHAVTRTRKRDVLEHRVIREVVPEHVQMSPAERSVYQQVTSIVREYALRRDAHEGFLLVAPQRQVSSSVAAAVQDWSRRAQFDPDILAEDLGDDVERSERPGPLVSELIRRVRELGDPGELRQADTKYSRLLEMLADYFRRHPGEKIVLFAFYRATLAYLAQRLRHDGIDNLVLTGASGGDKTSVIDEFQQRKNATVLLASEVASEGVDLQFCRVVINYDLPWNPMKVEQRIGRIDRIGQKSPKITIWNLFYADTIDERIYDRLYERLRLFEQALGGLEQVLGDHIRQLTVDLLRDYLTPEQERIRIDQTSQAIANLKKTEESLEAQASSLMAHGDYIIQQVDAARQMSRWISGEDLWVYLRDFFRGAYEGTQFQQVEASELVFDVRLSESARFEFGDFLRHHQLLGTTRLATNELRPVRVIFENRVGNTLSTRTEKINQFHPLVRFVGQRLGQENMPYHPAVAVSISRVHTPDFSAGVYVVFVDRWSVSGLRVLESLYFTATPLTDSSLEISLTSEMAEALVTRATLRGENWADASSLVNLPEAALRAEQLVASAELEYTKYVDQVRRENEDRASLQESSLLRHRDRQMESLETVLETHQRLGRTGLVRATQGRIEKLKSRINEKLVAIERAREMRSSREEVCLALIRVT